MRDVAYRVRIRLENEHGSIGLAAEIGKVVYYAVAKAEKEGILSAGATIASARLLSVELVDPQPGDFIETPPTPEISVGGEVEKSAENKSSPETT